MAGNAGIEILDGAKSLDLMDKNEVRGYLGKIEKHARDLHAKVANMEATEAERTKQIERMADDMRVATKRLAELDAIGNAKPEGAHHGELLRFIDNDGRVFLQGGGHESGDASLRRSVETGLLTTKPINHLHKKLQEDAEALYIVATATHGADAFDTRGNYRPDVVRRCGKAWGQLQATWKSMPKAMRKAWDDQTGSGGDFIPTPLLSTPFWQVEEYDPDGILGVFEEVQLDSSTVELPLGTSYPRPYKGGGRAGDNPAALAKSTLGTDKLTMALTSLYCLVLIYEDAAADAVLPAVPWIQSQIAMSLTVGERYAMFNSDTAATHQDDIANWDLRGMFGALDAGSIDYRRTVLGFRANALDGSNGVDRSTFSLATLAADVNAVGGPRGNPADMPIITSPEGYLRNFLNLTGVVSANDYGSRTPIAAGEIGTIFGHPIIQTDAISADLNTNGLFDNATMTKTGAIILNRRMHKRLSRRGQSISIALQPDVTVDGVYLRAKKRMGLKDLTKSTDAGVRYLYNMSK